MKEKQKDYIHIPRFIYPNVEGVQRQRGPKTHSPDTRYIYFGKNIIININDKGPAPTRTCKLCEEEERAEFQILSKKMELKPSQFL